jgi:hypothetical protein
MMLSFQLISLFRKAFFCLCITVLILGNVHAADSDTKTGSQFSRDDFSHWLDAAYIADATYKSRQDIEQVLASQGYTLKQFKQLQGFSVGYVIATNDKSRQHIIAVRGTSNMENIVVDAAFVLVPDNITGVDIHQGFLLSARDIYQQILPELTPGYTINTVGHSLGGAAALIIAMMLDAQGYSVGEVITFGQPKVTNISGSRTFKHLDVKRLVNPKDIVPLVPPLDPMEMMNLSIFWHQGTEIVLFKNNQYSVLSGMDSMMRATDFLNDMPSEQHLENHFMSTYIAHLKSKQASAEQIKYKSDFKFSDWFSPSSSKSK